jgi:alpha-tubulin suppressor-like RCC1 family protein
MLEHATSPRWAPTGSVGVVSSARSAGPAMIAGTPRRYGALGLVAFLLVSCTKKAPPLASQGTPIFAVGEPARARTLYAGGFGTCAKRKDGYWCWGNIGDAHEYVKPTRLLKDEAASLTLDDGDHYCLLTTNRRLECAGRNLDGELGDGSFTNRSQLAPVPGLSNVVQVAAGAFKTCAIVEVPAKEEDAGGLGSKHQVFCFGTDEGGPTGRRATPTRVGDIDDVRDLAVGWGLGCLRRSDGSVWCWGSAEYGQLGDGEGQRWGRWRAPSHDPVRVLYVGDAVGISAGGFGACVLTARGTVGCWGENSYGALGDGTTVTRAYPSDVVGLENVVQVAKGGFGHACALRSDGTIWAWGYRIGRAKGDGPAQPTPVQVPGIDDATEIASGHTHSCARRKNGSIWCWGDNEEGQVGDGTLISTQVPREALGPE